ncbi:hypothetical protein [Kribbella sp. NPDC004536]|uniref:hypothetical protein n=1 Tax=Kribbella sp. NPDC004536 TaxID=3364106 RepID=UPI0036A4CD1A
MRGQLDQVPAVRADGVGRLPGELLIGEEVADLAGQRVLGRELEDGRAHRGRQLADVLDLVDVDGIRGSMPAR